MSRAPGALAFTGRDHQGLGRACSTTYRMLVAVRAPALRHRHRPPVRGPAGGGSPRSWWIGRARSRSVCQQTAAKEDRCTSIPSKASCRTSTAASRGLTHGRARKTLEAAAASGPAPAELHLPRRHHVYIGEGAERRGIHQVSAASAAHMRTSNCVGAEGDSRRMVKGDRRAPALLIVG